MTHDENNQTKEMGLEYRDVVSSIKEAILQSQARAARAVNEEQLALYFGIGRFISANSRKGFWGTGAIDNISRLLQAELPGLRGFSARSLRQMRQFYEEWQMIEPNSAVMTAKMDDTNLALATAKSPEDNLATTIAKTDEANLAIAIAKLQEYENKVVPLKLTPIADFPTEAFLGLGFTHHLRILQSVKHIDERLFYIKQAYQQRWSVDMLERKIEADTYHHQSQMANNFLQTMPKGQQALRAINMFKDEYLLDFINVEELGVRDTEDIDERVVEQEIVHNIKNFIMTFGKAFSYIGHQVHYEKLGYDHWVDLIFFNRELRALVVVELKKGKFKPAYLGQLAAYLRILDDDERLAGENPSVGIILCKDADKAYVEYVLQDYNKPMGVATYKTTTQQRLRELLPPEEEMKKLMK